MDEPARRRDRRQLLEELRLLLDVEYWPSDHDGDRDSGEPSTDYEGATFLLAANLGALDRRRRSPLDFVDVQLGYRTRHYQDMEDDPQRLPFVGLGINLQAVCNRIGLRRLGYLFEYYQPPGLSIRWETDLND